MSDLSNRGFSLLELMIGTALSLVVITGFFTLFLMGQKATVESFNRHIVKSEMALVSGHIQRFMPSGDSRFFGFSGKTSLGDRPLARFLIPQPGFCRDLDSQRCSNDTSFLYIHYDKTTTPAVTAICLFPEINPDSVLVDTNNGAYGSSVFNPPNNTFTVTPPPDSPFATGTIEIKIQSLIAFMNPPIATLWINSDKPTVLQVTENTPGIITYDPGAQALPTECVHHLKNDPGNPGKKLLSSPLVRVPVEPYVLGQFTGGSAAISESEKNSNAGKFPQRLFVTFVRSVGPLEILSNEKVTQRNFGVRNCDLIPPKTLTCQGKDVIVMNIQSKIRIEHTFAIQLFDLTGVPLNTERFDVLTDLMLNTQQGTCQAPGCLIVKDVHKLPVAIMPPGLASESSEKLYSSEFSLLKQESLMKLRFRLSSNTGQEASFDVLFP